MFKKILIVCKDNLSEECSNVVREVVKEIKNLILDENFSVISLKELEKSHFSGVDLVITVGGDGTLIKTGSLVTDSLILGINPSPESSEGALASLTKHKIQNLKEILNGNYNIIQRQRARIILNGKILDELALNEVYIGAELNFHSSRYIVNFHGKKEEHRSAGIIITTGTGSSAWYKSIGGSPFHYGEKKLAFLVREPYYGKIFQPKILRGEILENEEIIVESKRDFGGIIAVDTTYYPFNTGDIVEINLSDKPLNVIVGRDNEIY